MDEISIELCLLTLITYICFKHFLQKSDSHQLEFQCKNCIQSLKHTWSSNVGWWLDHNDCVAVNACLLFELAQFSTSFLPAPRLDDKSLYLGPFAAGEGKEGREGAA